ncbi:MAG: Poly(3-hydroxyalkanoate) polymerase subunit PhaE [Pseudomonadota bacterium]|nr:Poly(3-hydroxyalkanoate) polymerase subunit PhaE [Pseudomonadota bacterium]
MTEQTSNAHSGVFDIDLVLRQARAYLAFGDQVRQFTDRISETAEAEADWGQALQQHFTQLKAAIAQSAENPNVNPELARLWSLAAETWSEAATTLGLATDTIPESLRQSAVWRDYQRTQMDYFNQLRLTATEALDLMEQRLNELTAAGKTISSLRELYNLWVDCNEETYGRMLRSSAYGELNGRLFNTLLRCYACPEVQS